MTTPKYPCPTCGFVPDKGHVEVLENRERDEALFQTGFCKINISKEDKARLKDTCIHVQKKVKTFDFSKMDAKKEYRKLLKALKTAKIRTKTKI